MYRGRGKGYLDASGWVRATESDPLRSTGNSPWGVLNTCDELTTLSMGKYDYDEIKGI